MILRKILFLILALMSGLLAANANYVAAASATMTGNTGKSAQDAKSVDFAAPSPVIQLRSALSRYRTTGDRHPDDADWYVMTAENSSSRPVTRILLAEDPADAALHFFPLATHAMIRQIASSDGGVTVEQQRAFGRHAFRITVPPATTAALAVRLFDAGTVPFVLAWSEPALIAHSRQLSIFIATVAGLIAAAAIITAGLAVMTGQSTPKWAALTLGAVFVVWLADIGLFDSGWNTAVGGPYGFAAMAAGLALAAAMRLTEEVVPFGDLWPRAVQYRRWGYATVLILSGLAFVGLPGATLLANIAVMFGAAGLAAYLVHRGVDGSRSARIFSPSAVVFALVTLAAGLASIGGFQDNPIASEIVGGFAAAGSVLLALTVTAGMSAAIVPHKTIVPASPSLPRLKAAALSSHGVSTTEPAAEAVAAIGASHQGVFDLDFHADTLRLSREASALVGLAQRGEAIPHSSWIDRVHPDDRAVYKEALHDYRNRPGLAFRIEFRVRSESGRYPWLELRATMMGKDGRADRCLGLVADVTTRRETEVATQKRNQFDPLTGLGNRMALMEEFDRLNRQSNDVVFAILDIDRFKAIHMSLGDAGADAILKRVADRLVKYFGDKAHVFRIGGDAFALLFTKGGEPSALGTELVSVCNASFFENGRKIFAPASVGVTMGNKTDEPFDLLRNAELALREAKRHGGGCSRIYTADLGSSAQTDAVILETDLRRALEEGQIDVFYQPIMRLSDRTVAGFEALLRWHHPERGLVWPSDFVAHSEETGLIVELGKFVLTRAAEDMARWQRHFPVYPPLFVSVNVSRRQLQDGEFEKFLSELLDTSIVTAGSLRLEVTESAIAGGEEVARQLVRIREMGASIAIDDFGIGFSSLSQIQAIPFDYLKIDKSFLAREGNVHGNGGAILHSIVDMAHRLKCGIVAEGVEREEDVTRLRTLGCEFAQGFHFSVPLTANEALNFIALNYDAAAAVNKPEQDTEPPSSTSGDTG